MIKSCSLSSLQQTIHGYQVYYRATRVCPAQKTNSFSIPPLLPWQQNWDEVARQTLESMGKFGRTNDTSCSSGIFLKSLTAGRLSWQGHDKNSCDINNIKQVNDVDVIYFDSVWVYIRSSILRYGKEDKLYSLSDRYRQTIMPVRITKSKSHHPGNLSRPLNSFQKLAFPFVFFWCMDGGHVKSGNLEAFGVWASSHSTRTFIAVNKLSMMKRTEKKEPQPNAGGLLA